MLTFIKKNNQLIHLDLSHTQMSASQIKKLVTEFKKAVSLQSVHLCGNPGRTPEVIEWVRE